MNVADALFVHARERPRHAAVEDGDRVVAYSELAALVDRAVARLRGEGIAPGDIVVIALPDTAEHVAVLLALATLGAISVTIDEQGLSSEQSKALEGLSVKAAILADGSSRLLDLQSIPVSRIARKTAGAGAATSATGAPLPSDGDLPAMLVHSSGTTGEPKRLFVTHRQLIGRCRMRIGIFGLSPAERFLQVPRLKFSWGRDGALVTIMLGGTIVLNHAESADDYLRCFSDRGITFATLTPSHLRLIMLQAGGNEPRWPRLKIGVASAPLMPHERMLARRRLTPQLIETYGTNETSSLALAAPEDHDRYPDSVGRLISGIEGEVVDESEAPLPLGEIGRIRFRGPSYFPQEYADNPEATTRHFRDGWFYPGDLAVMNEEGYVFLKGRADDIINNAGVKYFPAEVEAVLLSHPGVADVAVVGGPHAIFGEVSVACVVRSGNVTASDLGTFCAGRIAMHKAPAWYLFLAALPRVATGKPDKRKLKELFQRHLNSRSASPIASAWSAPP